MRRIALWIGVVVVLLAVALAAFIGPRNIAGLIRYGHTEGGTLRVGDHAPDVVLVSLDGKTRSHLSESL
ncbi:MAG: hypothetical protein NVSMB68_06270 [Thermoanaerobaculia bacterium]